MSLSRVLATLALLEALAYVLTYVLDWLQGPVTSIACWYEEWEDAIRGWWLR